MTTRRSFLGSILALAAAPAIVRAESLMPVAPPIWVPPAPKLYPCEIGRIDGFRIIKSEILRYVVPQEMATFQAKRMALLQERARADVLKSGGRGTITFRRYPPTA